VAVLDGLVAEVVAEVVGVVEEAAGLEEAGVVDAGVVEAVVDAGVLEVAGAAVVEVEEAAGLELDDAGLELEAEEPELVEAALEELPEEEEDEELPSMHDLLVPALMGKGAVVFVRPVLSRI
jgi:hypothetical protein